MTLRTALRRGSTEHAAGYRGAVDTDSDDPPTVAEGGRTAPEPWERYGWVIGAIWLLFLAFPLMAGLDQQSQWWARALVVLVVVGFAAVYIRGFIRLGYAEGSAERQAVGVRYLAALVAVLLCAVPLAGWDSLGMMPFIVAFAMFSLPLRAAGLFFAAAVAVTLGLLLGAGILDGAWPLAVIVTGVGLATGLTRLIEDRQHEHQRLGTQMVVATERERVARDVHDVLGHSLTVISLKADLAARLMDVDPARARAEVEQIHDLSRQALAEVRTTVGGLRVARLVDEVEAARTVLRDAGITADLPRRPRRGRPAAPHRARLGAAGGRDQRGAALRSHPVLGDPRCRPAPRRGRRHRSQRQGGQRHPGSAGAGHRRRRHPVAASRRDRRHRAGGAAVIRLLLADDQALVRGAMAALLGLEPDLEVVAEVGRGDEVVAAAREHRADVCLVDVEMPGLDGIEVCRALTEQLPGVRSLVVTTFGRPGYLRRAVEAGASGFVVKDTPASELAEAVRRVQAGQRVLDPALAAESLAEGANPLTDRERDVLREALTGAPIVDIARRVHLSPGTVRNYLSSAIGKTGVSTRAEAAVAARDRGWL